MSVNNTGGPAFPLHSATPVDSFAELKGMTLRDYFAAKAMCGMYTPTTDDGSPLNWKHAMLAKAAYMAADAMLKERES